MDDEQLLRELRSLTSRQDPVPAEVKRAAREAYGWRRVDEELAVLIEDSQLQDRVLAGAQRAADGPQALAFEGTGLSLDVEVTAEPGGRRRLVAQLLPPQPARVEVRHREGITSTEADELGRFHVGGIPMGPISLRCHPAGGSPISTEWTAV